MDATREDDIASSLCAILLMCRDEQVTSKDGTSVNVCNFWNVGREAGHDISNEQLLVFLFTLDKLGLIDLQEPPQLVLSPTMLQLLEEHDRKTLERGGVLTRPEELRLALDTPSD